MQRRIKSVFRPLCTATLTALVMTLSACATTGGGSGPPAALAGTRWVVTQIDGTAVRGDPLTADFGVDGRVNGNSGCNGFAGPFIQTGSTLQIGELLSTRRACIDKDRQQLEGRMLKILQGSLNAKMDRGQLSLRGTDGALLLAPASTVATAGYPRRAQFDCEGTGLTVVFDAGRADLTWSDGRDTLDQREAASGFWYQSTRNTIRGKQDLVWTREVRARDCRELR